jgi:nucleoporin NUP159
MEDTMLLALDADLTNSSTGLPIMYAYLNDGTLQGWYIDSSKPYPLMVTPSSLAVGVFVDQGSQSQASDFGQIDASMSTEENHPVKPVASVFGQTTTSTLGPPAAFEQKPSSTFMQPPAFGQPTSAFGQSPLQASPAFGQTSFGAFSGFNTKEITGSGFSGSSNPNLSSSFGGYGSGPSAFGPSGTSSFEQGSLGNNDSSIAGASGFPSSITREASMSDSTPSFGGLSLGSTESESSAKPGGGIFGSFSTHPASQSGAQPASGFGGPVKPAVGFGAFSKLQSTNNPNTEKPAESISAFGCSSSDGSSPALIKQSGFGQSGFGQSGFGQSGFGQSGFGQSGFGQASKPALSSASSITGRGFSAFASAAPAAFSGAPQKETESGSGGAFAPSPAGGGFSAFASNTPAAFGEAAKTAGSSSVSSTEKLASPFGSAFGVSTSDSGNTFTTPIASTSQVAASVARSSPAKAPTSSPDLSPEPSANDRPSFALDDNSPPPLAFKSSAPAAISGAFANIKTSPAAFRPASGFGAFGSDSTSKTSPFFKNSGETKPAPVSVFSNFSTATKPSISPAGPSGSAPTFGSPSLVGDANKSAFAPATPPSPSPAKIIGSGGFGAFSGTTSGFGVFAGPKKSFSDLLKIGDNDVQDAGRPQEATAAFKTPDVLGSSSNISFSSADSNKTKVAVVPPITPAIASPAISNDNIKQDTPESAAETSATEGSEKITRKKISGSSETISEAPSLGNISSAGSSFVEVSADTSGGEMMSRGESVEEDVQDGDDDRSFLSESFGSSSDGSYEDDEDSEGQGSESEGSEHSPSPVPTTVPLPESRSPSATPQPEVPTIEVTLPPHALHRDGPASRNARAPSTTPPGTPVKESRPLSSSSPASSIAVSSTPLQTPFGLGLGKPSTRPTRSSPLASAPMSGNDDDERTTPKPPVSPKPVFGALHVSSDQLPVDSSSDGQPSSKRSKTPPLLSSFGSIKATPISDEPILAVATLPATITPVPTPVVPSASPAISPPLVSSSPSLFEKPRTPADQDEIVRPASTPAFHGSSSSLTSSASPFSLPASKGFNASAFAPQSAFSGQSTPQEAFGNPVLPGPSNLLGNLFGAKVLPETQAPYMKPLSTNMISTQGPMQSGQGLFPAQPSSQTPGPFAPKTPVTASPLPTPFTPPKPPVQSDVAKMEEGMQKECALLVNTVHKELEEVSIYAKTPRIG